jgi:transcriptional regulator with XRE-family HTH domain
MGINSDIRVRFGEAVRRERQKHGWSQEQLADESGFDRSYIGGIERGERNPSLSAIHTIAVALGVSIEELFAATKGESGKRGRR